MIFYPKNSLKLKSQHECLCWGKYTTIKMLFAISDTFGN